MFATSAAVLLCAAACVPANSGAESERPASFTGGCDNTTQTGGDLNASHLGNYNRLLIQSAERLRATVAPAWDGRCAMRLEVHDGDFDANDTDRAEVAGDRLLWSSGQEVWYSLSFMLAPKYPLPAPGQWMVVDQFFAQNLEQQVSGGAPPLALEITPTKQLRVFVRGGAKASSGDHAPRESSYLLASASPGVWHEVLLHVHWSTQANGLIEAWQRRGDGSFSTKPQVSASGPNILTVGGHMLPVYVETGIYRSRSTPDQVVYYGGVWGRPERSEAEAFFPPAPTTSTTQTASTETSTTPVAESPTPSGEQTSTAPSGSTIGGQAEETPVETESVSPVFSESGSQVSESPGLTTETEPTQPAESSGAGVVSETGGLTGTLKPPLEGSPQPTGSNAQEGSGATGGSPTDRKVRKGSQGEETKTVVISLAPSPPSMATENSALVRSVRYSASAARERDAVGRLLCGATLASATMAFAPGHYLDSLRVLGTHTMLASGALTVSSSGRSRLALHVVAGGCEVLREAQRKGTTLRLSNSLSFAPPSGAAVTRTATFAAQL